MDSFIMWADFEHSFTKMRIVDQIQCANLSNERRTSETGQQTHVTRVLGTILIFKISLQRAIHCCA